MKSSYILFVESINKQKITKKTLKRRFIKQVDEEDYSNDELDEIINYLFSNCL